MHLIRRFTFTFLLLTLNLPFLFAMAGIREQGYELAHNTTKDRIEGRVVGERTPPEFSFPEETREEIPYLEFIAVGCAGTGRMGQKIVAEDMAMLASRENISFILYLGDNFYPNGVKSARDLQWRNKFENIYDRSALSMPFYAVLGNHDYYDNHEAQMEYAHTGTQRWRMPSAYYRFVEKLEDGTQVDFLGLDTTMLFKGHSYQDEPVWNEWFSFFYANREQEAQTISKSNIQMKWLERQLKSSKADWKIVFGHHPIFTGDRRRRQESAKFREMILSKLVENGTNLYISAHAHALEVFKPVDGAHFVVSGTGSKSRDKVYWTEDHLYAGAELGFVWFRLSSKKIEVIFVGRNQEILYVHTIIK